MRNRSRGLRQTVVGALAKVGLVWAVAVLGALFMATAAQGQHHDRDALSSAGANAPTSFSIGSVGSPRTAGLALALVVLGGGVTVLAVGASRGGRVLGLPDADEPSVCSERPLVLGLGVLS